MAANKITDLFLRNLKPTDKQQFIADGGGLCVRVRAIGDGGNVSFVLRYRFGGKEKMLTLVSNTLKEARKERDNCKAMIASGKDPAIERQLIIERERQLQIKQLADIAAENSLITVEGLLTNWLASHDIKKRKDALEIKRMFHKDVLPSIGFLRVQDVRKGHIAAINSKVMERDVPRMAKRVFGLMRQMFNYAIEQDFIEGNPTSGIKKAKVGGKISPRARVLDESEIKQLWQKMPDAGLEPQTEYALWIMLSTCCRVGELSRAQWQHIDFDKRTWIIPTENAKNKKHHTIYLSDFATDYFRKLKVICRSETWCYPNREDNCHVCDKSITRQIDGRQNKTIHSNRSKNNQALVLPKGKWTPHDLRRSGATMMGNLGINSDVIERCLNHVEENDMKRTYQHQTLFDEQSRAWILLGEKLELIAGDYDNVVPFKRGTSVK